MDLRISDILTHVRKQDLDLLGFPTQHCREETQSKSLKSVFQLDQVPRSDSFLALC